MNCSVRVFIGIRETEWKRAKDRTKSISKICTRAKPFISFLDKISSRQTRILQAVNCRSLADEYFSH